MGFKEELENYTHVKILFNEPMKKHTGYGVGGSARYYVEPDSLFVLNEIITLCARYKVQYKPIGNGTNVLVSDSGYDGLIINTRKLSDVYFKKDQIRAMSGVNLKKLIKFTLDHSLSGLEALYGIPATVGGAVVMNAGAFGHNISDRIIAVETLLNGKIKKYEKEECSFAYRTSRFYGKKEVVISATFSLTQSEKDLINASINGYKDLRKRIQPSGRSCGSVFKNPQGKTAGALIDGAGLKGFSVGGAKVSEKHGNFIVVENKSCATDVFKLVSKIKRVVKEKYHTDLKEEIEFLGEF